MNSNSFYAVYFRLSMSFLFVLFTGIVLGQRIKTNLIYVDNKGVMRYTSDNKEAAFFGVNYTVPFAFGYRSHKALGLDLERSIRQDVYHLHRLGLDAFRVHMWDTEITDLQGNLLNNEHLRLFDFLLAELKKYGIKTILTPLAFWGNGYPEPDEKTPGFSARWPKRAALVNDTAIAAMENYLVQLMKHVNPYTKLSYQQDVDIIAAEINNEPHHSGAKEIVTAYVNRMVAAMRNNGWNKPIFYNISESPAYADAVARSNIQGVSFQWYPSGLVANRSLKGNHLPHVDLYRIPFGDTIPEYRNKALMVYEFDAGDVQGSYMYPAMARSYRTAGFQWATQFAYDPLATANVNTEYQTHYVNLLYTPSKAISLLIASEVFHKVPRLKNYGVYPQDTLFESFRVSYKEDLSEMNDGEKFYYTNSTSTKPKDPARLKNIAGVGSSPVVKYNGTGAYFLDKLKDGSWQLEVYPDAVSLKDPFERASPMKEVTALQWYDHRMEINLPNFPEKFIVMPVDTMVLTGSLTVAEKHFRISPGIYLIKEFQGSPTVIETSSFANYQKIDKKSMDNIFLVHDKPDFIIAGLPAYLKFSIRNSNEYDRVAVEFRNSAGGQWRTVDAEFSAPFSYAVQVPPELNVPGILSYRVLLFRDKVAQLAFPGAHAGPVYSWQNHINESWDLSVIPARAPLRIFVAESDRRNLTIYNPDWRNNSMQLTISDEGLPAVRLTMRNPGQGRFMAFQHFFGDRIMNAFPVYKRMVVRARAAGADELKVKFNLIDEYGKGFSVEKQIAREWKDIEIDLNELKPDSILLLPRPYPGFHPLYFNSSSQLPFDVKRLEKLEVSFGAEAMASQQISLEIASIVLSYD